MKIRLCESVDGRPERHRSGRGIEEPRGGQGIPRSGERSQDRPGAASAPLARPARRRRRAAGDAARPAGAIDARPVEHARGDTEKKDANPCCWITILKLQL
jgi:hypothetical protein